MSVCSLSFVEQKLSTKIQIVNLIQLETEEGQLHY